MKSFAKFARIFLLCAVLFGLLAFILSCGETASYRVTFVSEGETYTTVTANVGEAVKLPPVPYKEGHDFIGWFLDDVTFARPFEPADHAAAGESLTVYAKWVDPNALPKYAVTFDLDGRGTAAPAVVTQGNPVGELALPTVPGYCVTAWYTDAAHTKAWNITTDPVTEDMTLYAVWGLETYHAHFMADGVKVGTLDFTMETDTLANPPAIPEKPGYTAAWEGYTLGTTDITVNAVYTPIPYSITYTETKDASNSNPATYTTDRATPLAPLTSEGFVFLGWTLEGQVVTEIPAGTTGAVTLIATWEKAPLTVTYMGATVNEHTNPTALRESDGVVTLKPATRAWYRFDGWYADEKLTERVTSLDCARLTENVTLWAKWTAETYTVSFYNGDTLLGERSFDVDHKTWDAPALPTKPGYTAKWQEVTPRPSNLRVEVVFTAISYTITYQSAPGMTHTNPATYTVEDADITLTTPTRDGYRFVGWYEGDQKITIIDTSRAENITLRAEWEEITYRISYENIKGVSIAEFPQVFTATTAEISLPTTLSAKGYTFSGWKWNGKLVTVIPAGTTEDVVLVAQWTPTPYTITYEGITTGDTNSNPLTYTIESTVSLTAPARRGYRFTGWTMNGVPTTTIPAGTTGALVLTAGWETISYNILYTNLNGVSSDTFPATFTVESEKILLPTALTADGYTFGGWKHNGAAVTELPAGTIGDVTLTAVWTPVSYKITYQGLETGATHTNPATYTIEDAITLLAATRPGYRFTGWTKDGTAITEIKAGTTGVLTLTANWEVETYSITYENTKGADISAFLGTYTVESGEITLPTLVPPGGYTFLGWKDASGKLVTTIPAGTIGDLVFTASFETTSYIVTLHPMGGSLSSKNFTVNLDQPFTFPVPRKEGHIFLGWYENTGDSKQLTDENGVSVIDYPYVSNRILYAHYVPVQHKVYFNTNGGNTLAAATYAWGTTFDPSKHIAIKGDGAYFAGWYTADEQLSYTDTTRITSDVTLYAKWMESTPVSTLEEFLAIKDNPSGTYHFTNDISLRGYEFVPWESFSGILDGNGFALKNFTLSNDKAINFAMIGTNSGTIKNLTISGFTFNSTHHNVGNMNAGILTTNNTGTIEGCTITGGVVKISRSASYDRGVSQNMMFGIFAGVNSGVIRNCVNEVGFDITMSAFKSYDYGTRNQTVDVRIYAGGIAGENSAGGIVELCRSAVTTVCTLSTNSNGSAYANVTLHIGGAVGNNFGSCVNSYADLTGTFSGTRGSSCSGTLKVGGFVGYNTASVEGSSSVGTITGGYPSTCYLGGFVGHNDTATGVIRSSHSSVNIDNGGYGGEIGGFVGNNSAKIMTSYASGDIFSDSSASVGGFVGSHHNGATITQSFASGNVRKKGGTIGAFVGTTSTTGTTRDCYYLSNATLMIDGVYVDHQIENENIIGKTYLELLSEELLVKNLEWDGDHWILLFDETPVLDWEIGIGHSYKTTVIEPSCEDFGYTVYECTHCQRFYISDFTSAWGHTFDPKKKVVAAATCTEGGYTSEVCLVCHKDIRTSYTEATGHISARVSEHVPPTCTEEGHNIHICADCGSSFTETLPAIGHDRYVTIQYQAPSCSMSTEAGLIEAPGHTAQVECATCHIILEASQPVAPHSFRLESTITSATCTTDGSGTWVCEYENCKHRKTDVIPATGHIDANRDGCCDSCQLFLGFEGVTFIEITTVEELMRITENPSAAYRLMNDLDLAGVVFTPLCSEKRPFTGYFDGNGKTIKNLNSSGLSVGGLFAVNNGTIRHLTITNVVAELTSDGTFGAIAARNDGTISECTVNGVIRIGLSQTLTVDDKNNISKTSVAVFGGLVGENGPAGILHGCKLGGTIGITATNIIDINVKSSVWYWLTRNYKTYFTSTASITFGGIIGVNAGTVENCRVSITDDISYSTIAGINRVGGIKFGYATVKLAGYYGVITGVNTGTAVGNTTDHSMVSSSWIMFNNTVGNTWADYYDVTVDVE